MLEKYLDFDIYNDALSTLRVPWIFSSEMLSG